MELNFKKLLKIESKDASLYLLVTLITGIGSFLMVPIFWSKLSPADYGTIAITEILAVFLSGISGFALDQSQSRFYYEWSEDERNIRTGTLWLANWLLILIVTALAYFLLFPLSNYIFTGIDFYPYLFFGFIISLINSLSSFPFATIRIMKLTKLYVVYKLASFLIGLFLQMLFILYLDMGVTGYFYGIIGSGIVTQVFLTFLMVRLTEIKIKFDHLREPLNFCLPLIPAAIIGNISSQVDKLLLQKYVDINLLGLYSVSQKFSGLISQLNSALKLSYGPLIFKTISDYKDSWSTHLSKMTIFYLFPLFLIVFGISIFIDDYVHWTGNESYLKIVNIVPFLCYTTLISCLNVYISPGIILSKKSNLLIIPAIVQLTSLIGAGLILLPNFNLEGILATKLISDISFLLTTLIISNRVSEWKPQYHRIFMFLFFSIFLLFLRKSILIHTYTQDFLFDIFLVTIFCVFGFFVLRKVFNKNETYFIQNNS